MNAMEPSEREYFESNVISAAVARDLILWENRCQRELEEIEFEAMMIRKYATCSFYKRCRNMTIEQLNERLWRICENLIPWNKMEIEKAEGLLYRNHQAREALQNSMQPFTGVDLKQETLIQKELF